MKTLFVNACVRDNSRTLRTAKHLLELEGGDITEVDLEKEKIQPLLKDSLEKRDRLISEGQLDDPMLRYARQFAEADTIVIAAPYWDLAFPAILRIYLEAVTVAGITFHYIDGIPAGLCKAKKLIYVTTAGGPIFANLGYEYVKILAESLYGIKETQCFKTENLDVIGVDVEALLSATEKEMDGAYQPE